MEITTTTKNRDGRLFGHYLFVKLKLISSWCSDWGIRISLPDFGPSRQKLTNSRAAAEESANKLIVPGPGSRIVLINKFDPI